ncbi:MAG: hypothetical protein AB7V42_09285 [Thermoleophilia bacterium]
MSPQRYLADTRGAAEAVTQFSAALARVGDAPTREGVRRAAPAMRAPLRKAQAMAARLRAERLDDRRLEDQRERASAQLDRVVAAMEDAVQAAQAGRPVVLRTAVSAFAGAVNELRGLQGTP